MRRKRVWIPVLVVGALALAVGAYWSWTLEEDRVSQYLNRFSEPE